MFLPSRSSHQASFFTFKKSTPTYTRCGSGVRAECSHSPLGGEGCVFRDGRVHLTLPAFIPDTRVWVCVSGSTLSEAGSSLRNSCVEVFVARCMPMISHEPLRQTQPREKEKSLLPYQGEATSKFKFSSPDYAASFIGSQHSQLPAPCLLSSPAVLTSVRGMLRLREDEGCPSSHGILCQWRKS